MTEPQAEIVLPSSDLQGDLMFFTRVLGLRIDMIFPADMPSVAVLSGLGLRLRLDRDYDAMSGFVLIRAEDAGRIAGGKRMLLSPGGTRIRIEPRDPPLVVPATRPEFVLRRLAGAVWSDGPGGAQVRDLLPSRLGGAIAANHIRIPRGGRVNDPVHYHRLGFQLVVCLNGWVDILYENQPGPIRLRPGDCCLQPPEIRHRVLETGDAFEAVEIAVPADHATCIDHDMTLPSSEVRPDRVLHGQSFLHDTGEGAVWSPFRVPGFMARETKVRPSTGGQAAVRRVRRQQDAAPAWTVHDAEIALDMVLAGEMTLEVEGSAPERLTAGDAFVIPSGLPSRWSDPSADLDVLEVVLPGQVRTEDHSPVN